MRFRNLPLGAILVLVAAGVVYSRDPSLVERLLPAKSPTATTAAAAPAPPPFVMPVPVTRVVKRSIPIVLDLFGPHGVDPRHHAAGQGLGLRSEPRWCPMERT